MKVFKKEITENYWVDVEPSTSSGKTYLLSQEHIQGQGEYIDFILYKQDKRKAVITFSISNGKACSLPQAPFGGFWVEGAINSETAEFFIFSIFEKMSGFEVNKIQLIQAPKPYQQSIDLFSYLLFKNGFQCKDVLSHHLFLGKKKIKKLVKQDTSKLNKLLVQSKLQTSCGPVQNFSFLYEVKEWNKSRGYEVSLDENRLIYQVSEFPENYHLITVSHQDQAVAHTLAVSLTPNSLYYFQSAIDPNIQLKNLGEILLMKLFQLAADLKADFIDLGSSDLSSGANHSLMFFKSRFANDISNKLTWEKDI